MCTHANAYIAWTNIHKYIHTRKHTTHIAGHMCDVGVAKWRVPIMSDKKQCLKKNRNCNGLKMVSLLCRAMNVAKLNNQTACCAMPCSITYL